MALHAYYYRFLRWCPMTGPHLKMPRYGGLKFHRSCNTSADLFTCWILPANIPVLYIPQHRLGMHYFKQQRVVMVLFCCLSRGCMNDENLFLHLLSHWQQLQQSELTSIVSWKWLPLLFSSERKNDLWVWAYRWYQSSFPQALLSWQRRRRPSLECEQKVGIKILLSHSQLSRLFQCFEKEMFSFHIYIYSFHSFGSAVHTYIFDEFWFDKYWWA